MSATSFSFDYNKLIEAASPEIIEAYKKSSILEMLITKTVGDIGIDKWAHAYLLETQEAAWTKGGFNPNTILLDLKSLKVEMGTWGQHCLLTESQKAIFARTANLTGLTYAYLGEDVGKAVTRAVWTGTDVNGKRPYATDYQFIKATGTNWNTNIATSVAAEIAASGTAIRPRLAACIDGGDWSTYTNFDNNIADLIGDMVSHGCNKSTIVVFYPDNIESVMMHSDSQYENKSRAEFIKSKGILDVRPFDYNLDIGWDASTAASRSKFDIWAVDLTKVVFGTTRDLTVNSYPSDFQGRGVELTAELWGGLLIVPIPKLEGTTQKYYKGVGLIGECSAS